MTGLLAKILTDLKILLDRLTSAWAGQLTTLELRWTATRAAYLDTLATRLSST